MTLLRTSKRKTSWEPTTPLEAVIEVEFTKKNGKLDLSLSVYEVGDDQVIQAFAEHAAAAGLKPPGGRTNVDMSGHPPAPRVVMRAKPGSAAFKLVREQHRELDFQEDAELRSFAATVREEIAKRARPVTTPQVKTYVKAQLAADDAEWLALCETNSAWRF